MRLLRLTSLYGWYIDNFYAARPALEDKSYSEQKAALDEDAFGEGDAWTQGLTPLGYEVMEVRANVEPLQQAWAREHGVEGRPDTWLGEIAAAQIKRFQPAVLLTDDFANFPYPWLTEIRRSSPAVRLIIGCCGAPYRDPEVFRAYDVVLSCIPEMVEHFRSHGHKSLHLNHAFNARVLERLESVAGQDIDFSFVGSINRGKGSHRERERLLLYLASRMPIQIFTPNLELHRLDELKTLAKGVLYRVLQALQSGGVPSATLRKIPKIGKAASWSYRPLFAMHPRLRTYTKPAAFGLEMYRTLKRSKMTLNSHIDISPRSASNMRLFEATGVGTCLITDMKSNLADMFEPDQEVVTYRSPEECLEKAQWLLAHPEARQAMARLGQERTLREHTFAQRAAQLDEIIRKEWGQAAKGS